MQVNGLVGPAWDWEVFEGRPNGRLISFFGLKSLKIPQNITLYIYIYTCTYTYLLKGVQK